MRSIVIHGHFYQPPRENPWLEEVEREVSAAPHHDWNARIEQECYRAVVAARVLAPNGRISSIVNTLEYISFNFGPTLLEWMEHAAPDTYARVLEADRKSVARLGHGNAIAQPYHHAILPLSSRRDKVTEVRWGIADFKRRFGRDPEGMWLPETALDDETLDVLAQEGMKFTIVAPGQVKSVPNDGHPGKYTTSNGRSIALCIYDGDISHGIAFGGILGDASVWEKRLLARTDRRRTPRDRDVVEPGHWEPDPESDGGTRPLTTGEMFAISASGEPARRGMRHRLVSAATDGETYGHHHRFAEMALARVVTDLSATYGVIVENFASYIANQPCTDDVEIVGPSAWSCAHGVERWRSNCTCRMRAGTNQEWRTPLREAIAELAEGIHAIYEREGKRYFTDPWAVRDAYGEMVATPSTIGDWVQQQVAPNADEHAGPASRAFSPQSLLEMERGALRIFTSCAWFFDDIGGIEPLEVLRYAARAIELAGPDGAPLEEKFLAKMATAISNDPSVGTGRDVYLRVAKPNVSQFARLAGSVAAARAVASADADALATSAALRVEASNGTVAVQQLRAGRLDVFTVAVSGAGEGERATVREPVVAHVGGSPPINIAAGDMTERQRAVIARGMRRQLLRTAFGPNVDVSSAPIDGDRVDAELVTAVTLLGRERSEDLTNRVTALLDLLELEGRQIPFDAQTRFHDAFMGAGRSEWIPAEIAAIANRLGFA
jgi:hypothetical protein